MGPLHRGQSHSVLPGMSLLSPRLDPCQPICPVSAPLHLDTDEVIATCGVGTTVVCWQRPKSNESFPVNADAAGFRQNEASCRPTEEPAAVVSVGPGTSPSWRNFTHLSSRVLMGVSRRTVRGFRRCSPASRRAPASRMVFMRCSPNMDSQLEDGCLSELSAGGSQFHVVVFGADVVWHDVGSRPTPRRKLPCASSRGVARHWRVAHHWSR